jgi:dolichol-phosphate mannosyltransferase
MISVILPARNERQNVLALILEIHEALQTRDHEIILVDDDSMDGTLQAVGSLNLDYVRPFCRQGKRGLGSAVGFGLGQAQGEEVLVMDSDFNHRPEYISWLVEGLDRHDCVCGSRFLSKEGTKSLHGILSFVFNRFVRAVTGGRFTDYSYGFFAARKSVLTVIDFSRVFRGHGDYAIRLLFTLEQNSAAIAEIPVINGKRRFGRPNRAYVRNFLSYFCEVIRLAFNEKVKVAR